MKRALTRKLDYYGCLGLGLGLGIISRELILINKYVEAESSYDETGVSRIFSS